MCLLAEPSVNFIEGCFQTKYQYMVAGFNLRCAGDDCPDAIVYDASEGHVVRQVEVFYLMFGYFRAGFCYQFRHFGIGESKAFGVGGVGIEQ